MIYQDFDYKIQVGLRSLVGFVGITYPASYGNYCSIGYPRNEITKNWFLDDKNFHQNEYQGMLINMCYENLVEIQNRLRTDSLKIRVYDLSFEDKNPNVAIVDDRIPQDWYLFWKQPYCSGCSVETANEILKNLGERYTNLKEMEK